MTPEELEEIASDLATAQRHFDRYQRACFPERPAEFFALELCGEAGELANKEKKVWKGKAIPHHEQAEEAADVFIALMNYCNARGISLGVAVEAKLREIERRRVAGTH